MPRREPRLFHESGGSVIKAYLLMKAEGSANVPPMWVNRASKSRKSGEKEVAKILKKTKGRVKFTKDLWILEDWELRYRKECFLLWHSSTLGIGTAGKDKAVAEKNVFSTNPAAPTSRGGCK